MALQLQTYSLITVIHHHIRPVQQQQEKQPTANGISFWERAINDSLNALMAESTNVLYYFRPAESQLSTVNFHKYLNSAANSHILI